MLFRSGADEAGGGGGEGEEDGFGAGQEAGAVGGKGAAADGLSSRPAPLEIERSFGLTESALATLLDEEEAMAATDAEIERALAAP